MKNIPENSTSPDQSYELAERCLPFYSNLLRYATSMTQNEDEAHDLVQTTFLRILRASGNFESDKALLSWMISIMRNLYIDDRRKKVARETFPVENIEAVAPVERMDDEIILNQRDHAKIANLRALVSRACIRALNCVEDYVGEIDQAILNVLEDCFSRVFMEVYIAMPLGERVIFALAAIFDYSYREIMEILRVNEPTLKSRLFKARNKVHNDIGIVGFARRELGLMANRQRSGKRPRSNGRTKTWY